MQYRKIGLALALSATFGLLACGDSDSSSNATSGTGDDLFTASCKVQKDPFKATTKGYGFTNEVTVTFDDGKIITKTVSKFDDQEYADEACEDAKEEAKEADEDEDVTVKCDGKTTTITYTEEGEEEDYEDAMTEETFVCEFINSMAANSSDSKSGKSSNSKSGKSSSSVSNKSSDSKSGKSSSSVSGGDNTDKESASKIDGKMTYEIDGMKYYGNGCDFKKSDKKWEYTYTYTDITKLTTEVSIKCTRNEIEEEGYTRYEVKCVDTQITTGKGVNIYCYEIDEETSHGTHVSTCKDGEWKEIQTITDDEDILFYQKMAECQRTNGHPEWVEEHSMFDDYDDEDNGDDGDDAESSSSSEDESSSSTEEDNENDDDGEISDITGCGDFDIDDDVWEFSYKMGGIKAIVKVEWLSKDEYKMTSYIEGLEDEEESETKTIEDGKSRQSMYDELCEDND